MLIIGGIAGEKSYYDRFWQTGLQFYNLLIDTYGLNPNQVTFLFEQPLGKIVTDQSTAENVISAFHTIYASATSDDRFILLMSGHANQSGKHLKFNLPGRDLFAQEYANMIRRIQSKTKMVFFDFPYSGKMISLLPHPDTVVITSCSNKEGYALCSFGLTLLNRFRQNPSQSLLKIMEQTQIDISQWYTNEGLVQVEHPQIKGTELNQTYLGIPVIDLKGEIQQDIEVSPFDENHLRTLAKQSEISSRIMNSQNVFDINEDSSYTHTVCRTIRIIDPDDRHLGQVSVPYTRGAGSVEVRYARTILPSGDIIDLAAEDIETNLIPPGTIEARMFVDARLTRFELPQMQSGCIIDYCYTRKSQGQLLEGEFWQQIYVQEPVQVSYYELTIVLPHEKTLRYQSHPSSEKKPNFIVQPEISKSSYTTTYQFQFKDLPPLIHEPFMPDKKDLAYSIAVSTIPSWEPLVEWYATLIRDQTQTNIQIQNKVKELTLGVFSQKEKIRKLYNFVANEIDYVGIELGIWAIKPHSSPRVFREKHGDCKDKSTLLGTMLSELGISSYPVLISAGKSRNINRQVPSLAYFNHMILAVKTKSSDFLFLDPTATGQPFDQLPVSDQNRWVMIINPDAEKNSSVNQPLYQFDKTPTQSNNHQIAKTSVQVSGSQTIIVNQEIRFSGYFNNVIRQHVSSENSPKARSFFRDLLELNEDTEVSQLRFSSISPYESRLLIAWKRSKHLIGLGHQLLLEIPSLPLKYDQLLRIEKRDSPVSLPTIITVEHTCKVSLAKSFQIDQTPETQSLVFPSIGSFELNVKSSKRRITMLSTFTATETLIPAKDYQKFQLMLDARQKSKRVVLSKR
ncbi:hypothetical protein CMK19_19565 [Candidatus Poribacteria bacterium]|nr:hypothetical protein [Candidatus Poribacteria bacterium]